MKIWGFQDHLDLLLINSPLSDYSLPHPGYTIFQPPIGLATIASFLEKRGLRVGIWDTDADKVTPEGIALGIRELCPRWIGFNTFTSGFNILCDIVSRIRIISPETRIMLGGTHATTAGEDFLAREEFKNAVVVKNDGEFKVEALLKGVDLREIPGLSFVESGSFFAIPEDPKWLVQDIDHPDHELNRTFVPYDPTLGNIAPDGKRRAFIASSRGCPYNCTYCASSCLTREGKPVRFRSSDSVVREVIGIIQRGVLDIKFNDELVWVSESRIRAVLGGLREAGYGREMGLELRGNGRANIIASAGDETLDLMKEAGVKRIGIGVEQGTAEGMSRVKKNLTPEQVITATTRLAQRGIPVLANFMFGLPGEDEKETRATVALAKTVILIGREYGVPVEIDGYKYRPYPGTELWEELISKGYAPEDLERVVQTRAKDGTGSHLQVEPFLNLADIDPEIERLHRGVLDQLMRMSVLELKALDKEYPVHLCLEGNSVGVERRRN